MYPPICVVYLFWSMVLVKLEVNVSMMIFWLALVAKSFVGYVCHSP